MKTRVVSVSSPEFREWTGRLNDFFAAIVFGGDRLRCCDEAAIGERGDHIVGAATIAPQGEMGSGPPEIVGLYVVPEERLQGHGAAILTAAIRRCLERGFVTIQVVAISRGGRAVVESLPEDLRAHVSLEDQSAWDITDLLIETSQP